MSTYAEKFKAYREKLGLTCSALAAKLGIHQNYIYQIEVGTKEPGTSLKKVFDALESSPLPYSQSEKHAGTLTEDPGVYAAGNAAFIRGKPVRLIPIISWAQAGQSSGAFYEQIPESWQEQMATDCPDAEAVGVTVRGDSMLPEFREGNVAVIMPTHEPRNGCFVVAKMVNDGVYFKLYQVRGEGDERKICLGSLNPNYHEMICAPSEFQWIYPVYAVTKFVWG